MGFALRLGESLRIRESEAQSEIAEGDALGAVLGRYLLAVEAAADTDMLTSILLLDGNQLRHGAAPSLPPAYCEAIDGGEIGPAAGSCGTAAYLGHAIYVTDVANDPLWADYRDVALQHGLRACWSTPICDDGRAVIGTFAIYHLTRRAPTRDEVAAIGSITDHVARAIMWSRDATESPSRPRLQLVSDNGDTHGHILREIAHGFEAIGKAIEHAMASAADEPGGAEFEQLRRAKQATERGAAVARRAMPHE